MPTSYTTAGPEEEKDKEEGRPELELPHSEDDPEAIKQAIKSSKVYGFTTPER